MNILFLSVVVFIGVFIMVRKNKITIDGKALFTIQFPLSWIMFIAIGFFYKEITPYFILLTFSFAVVIGHFFTKK